GAIARARVTAPETVFVDEPTTGLDPVLVNTIHHLILDLHRRYRFTAVMVSHEIPQIFEIADTVAMLHEGRIVEVGPPAAIQASQNRVVRQFIRGVPENSEGRSEEHTSELQSPDHLVCRLLLEKKKKKQIKQRNRMIDR